MQSRLFPSAPPPRPELEMNRRSSTSLSQTVQDDHSIVFVSAGDEAEEKEGKKAVVKLEEQDMPRGFKLWAIMGVLVSPVLQLEQTMAPRADFCTSARTPFLRRIAASRPSASILPSFRTSTHRFALPHSYYSSILTSSSHSSALDRSARRIGPNDRRNGHRNRRRRVWHPARRRMVRIGIPIDKLFPDGEYALIMSKLLQPDPTSA